MRLEEALRVFSEIRKIESEMPLPQAHCLLLLAKEDEGISLSDLAQKAGITLPTASRYIGNMGKRNRFHEDGLKLVEAFEDPMERRKKIIRLTSKGKALVTRILGEKHADLS